MGKAFRYTIVTAIAAVMILGILIATQEIKTGIENMDVSLDLSNAELITPEPTYKDIELPSFAGSGGFTMGSIPQSDNMAEEQHTPVPTDEQTPGPTDSQDKPSSTAKPKQSAQPKQTNKPEATTSAEVATDGKGTQNSSQLPDQAQSKPQTTPSSSHYKAPSGYTAFEDGGFYISYPKGWAKAGVSGDYGGTSFTSPADSSGDTLKLTLVSTEVTGSDPLDAFAADGSKVINEVIAGFGISASVVEKTFESIGIHSSYYILIEVPNDGGTTHILQSYIKHGNMLTMVELSGKKGKATKEQQRKILDSFESKQKSYHIANDT